MSGQSKIRTVLENNKIDYTIKTVNRKKTSPFDAGSRARTGSFGESADLMYEYIIYVKKQDYERARHLL